MPFRNERHFLLSLFQSCYMRKLVLFLFFSTINVLAQNDSIPDFEAIDYKYREDQFYVNLTYNILENRPFGVTQNSFSAGINAGFLRDFPINKDRTFAIAPGLGLSFSNYKQNLLIDDTSGTIVYSKIAADVDFDRNKLALYAIDLPIEFRWRTSTPESHKFWRIYTGFKMSYLLYSESRYVDSVKAITINNNPDLNKFLYGAYLTAGYNSWNLYVYYGFNSVFSKSLDTTSNHLNTLNLGFMFYIL